MTLEGYGLLSTSGSRRVFCIYKSITYLFIGTYLVCSWILLHSLNCTSTPTTNFSSPPFSSTTIPGSFTLSSNSTTRKSPFTRHQDDHDWRFLATQKRRRSPTWLSTLRTALPVVASLVSFIPEEHPCRPVHRCRRQCFLSFKGRLHRNRD